MQAEQLTRALESGDFETAERLAVEFGDSVAASGNAAVLREGLQILHDCLHLTRVLRAHLATQVRANSTAIEYQTDTSERRRWQFEG